VGSGHPGELSDLLLREAGAPQYLDRVSCQHWYHPSSRCLDLQRVCPSSSHRQTGQIFRNRQVSCASTTKRTQRSRPHQAYPESTRSYRVLSNEEPEEIMFGRRTGHRSGVVPDGLAGTCRWNGERFGQTAPLRECRLYSRETMTPIHGWRLVSSYVPIFSDTRIREALNLRIELDIYPPI